MNRNGKDKHFKMIMAFVVPTIIAISIAVILVSKFDLQKYFLKESEFEEDNTNISKVVDEKNVEEKQDVTENNENSKTDMFDLEGISLYNVQVGSFATLENAYKSVEEFNSKGIGAYIFKIDDAYKVYAGSFFGREYADSYKEFIKLKVEDAFISEKYFTGKSLIYKVIDEEKLDELYNLIKLISDIYSKETVIWTSALSNKENNSIINEISKNNIQMESLINSLMQSFSTKELNELTKSINENLLIRKNVIQKLENNSLTEAYNEFNKGLINYINLIRNN